MNKKQFVEQEIARSDYHQTCRTLRAIERREDAEDFAWRQLAALEAQPSTDEAFTREFGGMLRRFLGLAEQMGERNIAMDQFGPLPVTLAGLEVRLRRGETLNIERPSTDGFAYTLSFEGERFLLRQGSTVHPFRQIEPAVLTLLCCLGEFQALERSASQPEVTL